MPDLNKTTATPPADAAGTDPGTLDKSFAEEIDASVDRAMQEIEDARGESEPDKEDKTTDDGETAPEESDADGGEAESNEDNADGGEAESDEDDSDEEGEPAGGDDPEPIPDALIERAIKAGFSLSEARKYADADLLTTVCERIEATTRPDSGDGRGNSDARADTAGGDDPLAAIPDLDPEEYDEQIVSGFKAMKDLIRSQQDTIKGLRSHQGDDWFASQVNGLGEGVTAQLEEAPEKREALKTKFDLLEAGYRATGQTVDRETVFREAADLVLKDERAKASDEAKKKALAKRRKQHIQRPSSRQPKPKGDALEDVAGELDRRFFDRR